MEFTNLNQKIEEAGKESLRNVQLFGTDNFRSWMLHFPPGDSTPMHYHQSPETFLVIAGKCSVKDIKGNERILEKNDIVFFQYPFVALDVLDGAFPGNYEESLRRLVVMHRRAVARRKVQHPRAKIVGAEELDISETFLSRFFDLLIEVGELHGFLRPVRVCARLLESEGGVNLCVESEAR